MPAYFSTLGMDSSHEIAMHIQRPLILLRFEQVYYLPLYRTFQGFLTQLRLRPGIEAAGVVGAWKKSLRPNRGDGFEIDWVSCAHRPVQTKLRFP